MSTPVPLVLTLWSIGHSQRQVAEMVGLPNARHVERVVRNARAIADPRAAVHVSVNHKATGNARNVKAMLADRPTLEVVPLVSKRKVKVPFVRTHCRKGLHLYAAENVATDNRNNRSCKACRSARERLYRMDGK